MKRDDDGFGIVSRAERRAADAFYAALMGRRLRPRPFGEAFARPLTPPPLIEGTYTPSLEPLAEDPTPVCGFFGPGGAMRTLDQLRADMAQVAKDQWKAWHTGAVPRLENDVNLFWLLFAYNVSANAKISADQVKMLHAAAKPLSFAALIALTADVDIKAEVKRLRDMMLAGIASPPADLKIRVDEAIKAARESHFDTKSGPWSAVFVSAVVRGAAIVHGVEVDPTKPLFVSVKHIEYTKEALRRTPGDGRPGVAGTYHAFTPGVRDVAVGDIIVQDRRPRLKETDVTTLSLSMDNDRITHGDIVIEVKGDRVVTIGGNVCNSVRFRHYPVQNKRLVVERNQLFAQENSLGQVPVLPAESCHDANDDLESQSTKRIFALLSLVDECPAAPTPGAKS
jgi:hypothetical protein